MTAFVLHTDHLADLRRSGLSDETIRKAGLYTARPGDLNRLCGRDLPEGTSGLVFPYDRDFARVKVFPPLKTSEGRDIKYLQPAGSPVRAYLVGLDPAVLRDPTVSLRITEGEKKKLALDQAELPTIGLGGIWNFRTKDLAPDALTPDLEAIAWAGRIVYLAPDSDAWDNEQILLAVYRLGRLLEARGATVLVIRIPTLGTA